ncbi:BrxE family protein [Shewanella sp. ISTPL2]|uniref:BrxE family protein n=1 Tax=Shewanella TaxID=22 RepID=UPI0015699696|nr:BrxE family protein [Shewanella sp. ISTPL2]
MNKKLIELIAELKLIIGFLGEKSQYNWWESNFLGASSGAFLTHTFPRTKLLSQYNGVSQAALIVHDDRIGIGQNYHIFRLPVSVERSVARAINEFESEDKIVRSLSTKEAAEKRLSELAYNAIAEDGPMNIGIFDEHNLENLIKTCAGCYVSAFEQDKKCFPFMKGANVDS